MMGFMTLIETLPRIKDALLVVAFGIALGGVFGADWYMEGEKLPGRAPYPKVGKITNEEYYDGRGGPKKEREWMNASYVGRLTTMRHNELAYKVFQRNTPASWLGRDGWLFVPKRVREFRPAEWDEIVAIDVAAITSVDRFVKSKGAHLVVALVPDRARIYPDKAYHGGQLPAGKAAFLPRVATELREQGVHAIDLTEALVQARAAGRAPFYADDHHWTSAGAKAGMDWVVAHLPEEVRPALQGWGGKVTCRPRTLDKAKSESSLVRKLGFEPKGALEESFRRHEPRTKFGKCGARGWSKSCATYWGSSYGLFGSPEFFAIAAKCPTRFIYKAGRGSSWAPLTEIKRLSKQRSLGGRHVIVWEIPEYHLVGADAVVAEAFQKIRDASVAP